MMDVLIILQSFYFSVKYQLFPGPRPAIKSGRDLPGNGLPVRAAHAVGQGDQRDRF
jgi:hypothetical protein